MPTLKLISGSVSNPLTLDLSPYLRLQPDQGTDPADPAFSDKIWGRSLLKEGATLALEQLTEKELMFPVAFKGTSQSLVNSQLVIEANQILTTPGSVCSWQDDGLSQPTYFDILSGQVDIENDYFRGRNAWCNAKVRIFTQPYGRTGGPRVYAAASGVGPLLMISPYASGGAITIGQSTQAGVSGYGGAPMGASSGVFYAGAPSLAGDAPTLLQVSYVGPLPGASNTGVVPYVAVSLLPDQNYQPLITLPTMVLNGGSTVTAQGAVASQFRRTSQAMTFSFPPFAAAATPSEPTVNWTGAHRLFGIARASTNSGIITSVPMQILPGPLTPVQQPAANVPCGPDWGVYDLGVFTLRASEPPQSQVQVLAGENAAGITIDVCGFVMLPDNATWFFNPTAVNPSQYGLPPNLVSGTIGYASAPFTNTLLLDDTLGDQFVYAGASQTSAPSPLGSVPSAARMTQYTRGLVPRPDPKNGMPIIAILGVAQPDVPSAVWTNGIVTSVIQPGASWANSQQLRTMAQVNVLERTRYILP